MKNTNRRKENKLLLPSHHRWESDEDETQKQNCQNQINQQSVCHLSYLLSQRLKTQATIATTEPNTTNIKVNLSRAAGSTIEAIATKPMSDAMSDNLSSCFSVNFGKLNCTYKLILLQQISNSLISINSLLNSFKLV